MAIDDVKKGKTHDEPKVSNFRVYYGPIKNIRHGLVVKEGGESTECGSSLQKKQIRSAGVVFLFMVAMFLVPQDVSI